MKNRNDPLCTKMTCSQTGSNSHRRSSQHRLTPLAAPVLASPCQTPLPRRLRLLPQLSGAHQARFDALHRARCAPAEGLRCPHSHLPPRKSRPATLSAGAGTPPPSAPGRPRIRRPARGGAQGVARRSRGGAPTRRRGRPEPCLKAAARLGCQPGLGAAGRGPRTPIAVERGRSLPWATSGESSRRLCVCAAPPPATTPPPRRPSSGSSAPRSVVSTWRDRCASVPLPRATVRRGAASEQARAAALHTRAAPRGAGAVARHGAGARAPRQAARASH